MDSWGLTDLFLHYSAPEVPEKSTTYLKPELVPFSLALDLESIKGKEKGEGRRCGMDGQTALLFFFFF